MASEEKEGPEGVPIARAAAGPANSQDTKLREDYASDMEDNREWRRHARAVRDQILVITRARLEARARGAPRRSDLLGAMIASYEQDAGRASNSPEEDAHELVEVMDHELVAPRDDGPRQRAVRDRTVDPPQRTRVRERQRADQTRACMGRAGGAPRAAAAETSRSCQGRRAKTGLPVKEVVPSRRSAP